MVLDKWTQKKNVHVYMKVSYSINYYLLTTQQLLYHLHKTNITALYLNLRTILSSTYGLDSHRRMPRHHAIIRQYLVAYSHKPYVVPLCVPFSCPYK